VDLKSTLSQQAEDFRAAGEELNRWWRIAAARPNAERHLQLVQERHAQMKMLRDQARAA